MQGVEDMRQSMTTETDIKAIRKFIYDTFIKTSHAPLLEQIVSEFTISKPDVERYLNILAERRLIVMQPFTNRILMAQPFSNIPTHWIVKCSPDHTYYANCAWDTIAMHFALHKSIDVESFCVHCCEPIKIRLENEAFVRKDPQTLLIAISKPASRWWDNVVDTCANHMNFFCTESHMNDWSKEQIQNRKIGQINVFTDPVVLQLSRFLYDKKTELEYQRPTDEEERKQFKELNLTGSFWEI